MPKQEARTGNPLLPILLTAFIDLLGIGIIIPVYAPLIIDDQNGLLPSFLKDYPEMVYGLMVACYPLAQFLGAPLLGALSDRHGRKPLLSLSLLGSMLGYMIFAYGVLSNNLWLILVARALDGFTGGNISIVFSAIADFSESAEKRARNFGLVGMMVGLGFILGPLLGGFLADDEILPWFGPSVPFWAAAALCGINVLLVLALYKETLKVKSDKAVSALAGFRNLRLGFSLPNLRSLFMVGFLATFGFSFFTQFFSVYMIQEFSFKEKDLGLMFGYMGICIAMVQGGLMRVVGKRMAPSKIVVIMLLLLGLAIPAIVLPDAVWGVMLVLLFIAIFHGLSQPNLNALVSEQAEPGQQGMIMGINQSMASFGNAIPPLLGGFLGAIDATIPLLAGGLSTLVAWMVFQSFYRRKTLIQG